MYLIPLKNGSGGLKKLVIQAIIYLYIFRKNNDHPKHHEDFRGVAYC